VGFDEAGAAAETGQAAAAVRGERALEVAPVAASVHVVAKGGADSFA
jgi:hypothetical protein